jgi:hypothetical protein
LKKYFYFFVGGAVALCKSCDIIKYRLGITPENDEFSLEIFLEIGWLRERMYRFFLIQIPPALFPKFEITK